MASKRLSKSTVDWAQMAQRAGEHQKPMFNAFKSKSDAYLRRVLANPETAPKIDWSYYKKNVALAGLVDNFQKQYDSLQVPYPPDKVTSKIEALEKEFEVNYKQLVADSNARIAEFNKDLEKWKKIIPVHLMTMEEFCLTFPEIAFDCIDKPTFWPHHDLDQQPGYVPPEDEAAKAELAAGSKPAVAPAH